MESSFHDNYIHSIEFADEDYQTNLILDIDHIKEWICENNENKFIISPAHLIFQEVSNLEIKIDKPGLRINSYLDTILDIERSEIENDRSKYSIELLDQNYIKFEAKSYILSLYGKDHVCDQQFLTVKQRAEA